MRSAHSYPGPLGLQHVCWLFLIQSHDSFKLSPKNKEKFFGLGSTHSLKSSFMTDDRFSTFLTCGKEKGKKVHDRNFFRIQEPTCCFFQWQSVKGYFILSH